MAKLNISVSPHIHDRASTKTIMTDVCIALIPALLASVHFFGLEVLFKAAISVLTCIVCELLFELITKRPVTINDMSATVTGLLLAMNTPVKMPEWQLVIGAAFAIIVVKQLFGGIGCNFANPAIAARVMMILSFTGTMTTFSAPRGGEDLFTGATPLAAKAEELPSLLDMFLGKCAGSFGETCSLALIIGFIYLLCRRVISWHIPVCFCGTVFVLSFCFGGFSLEAATYQLLSGGLLLGAIFMATDYVTSPNTKWGKVIFGVGCGLITFAIRRFGAYPEGVSFAILFMNILNPYICKIGVRRPVGAKAEEKGA